MIDFLFSLGQVASALVLLYGGYHVIRAVTPLQHKAGKLSPLLEDETLLLRHLRSDI